MTEPVRGMLRKYPKRPGAQRFAAYWVPVTIHGEKTVREARLRGDERIEVDVIYYRVQEQGKRRQWANARDVRITN